MKKPLASAFLLIATAVTPALADEAAPLPPPMKTIGVDAVGVLPIGDYGDVARFAAGALLRLEIPVGTGFVTGRAGALFHAVRSNVANLTMIPIYGGYRLPVGTGGFYVAGELGITIGYASGNTAIGNVSSSDSEVGVTLSAGMRSGKLDLRGGLFLPDVDDLAAVFGSVGYDFAAF